MANIRSIDMMLFDDIFEMGGGYVLNFSDRTFAQFFAEELNIDINDPVYSRNGGSKGKGFAASFKPSTNRQLFERLKLFGNIAKHCVSVQICLTRSRTLTAVFLQ
jgi:hypothetical protein